MSKVEKTNRELFLAESAKIVGEAVRNGTNMQRIRALRNYMAEVLTDATLETKDGLKARILGEMFSTNESTASAILAFAKDKAKYQGVNCGDAMVEIAKNYGLYSSTAEIWTHVAKMLTTDKKTRKDYMDLVRALRAELRAVADKANNQMNAVLEELKIKAPPTGKKGGKGKKPADNAPNASEPAASPVETVVRLESGLTPIQQLDQWMSDGTLKIEDVAALVLAHGIVSDQEWTSEVFQPDVVKSQLAIMGGTPVAA